MNLQTFTKTEIEKMGDIQKLAELNGVAKAAHVFYKAKDDQVAAQHAKEIYMRTGRQAGFLLLPEKMPREQGGHTRYGSFSEKRATPYQEALDGAGITPFIASTWQKMAKVNEDIFEEYLANARYEHTEYTMKGLFQYAAMLHVSDGSNEWYTPKEYIDAAREVMGKITLDPATSEKAQEIIKADKYYTEADDGLSKNWEGTVWLNPPFSTPDVQRFVRKCEGHYRDKDISQALVLANNATDTRWFHLLASQFPFCLTQGRVPFWNEEGQTLGGRQGQVIFYLGKYQEKFRDVFSRFGLVVHEYK